MAEVWLAAPGPDTQGAEEKLLLHVTRSRLCILCKVAFFTSEYKAVTMAGDCGHTSAHYVERPGEIGLFDNSQGCGPRRRPSPNFELIDGQLYRKKLEKGFINYREVLDEERRHEAISTFHRRRPGQRHLSLEETYKYVAENYWWEGMNITVFVTRRCT